MPAEDNRELPLAVYVVHFRAEDWLSATIESLVRSNLAVDVTVINNGGDASVVCSMARVIEARTNGGFTGGFNAAVAHWQSRRDVRGDAVGIACHDVVVDVAALGSLVSALDADPRLGVIGPSSGGFGPVLGSRRGIDLVTWISGALLVLRREALEQTGLMDTSLGSYCEDVDWCIRARRQGWDVGRDPSATAQMHGTRHRHRAERLTRRNKVVLAFRYRDPSPTELLWLELKVAVAQVGLRVHPHRHASVPMVTLVYRFVGLCEGLLASVRHRRSPGPDPQPAP